VLVKCSRLLWNIIIVGYIFQPTDGFHSVVSYSKPSVNSLIAANFFTVLLVTDFYHRGMWQMIINYCQLLYLLWKPTGTTDYNIWFCTIAYYSIRLPGVYAAATQKTYFRMSKKLDKKISVYI
jgi:hypothetical protein